LHDEAVMVMLDEDNLTPIIEAMDHGRDGYPRWIVATAVRRRVFPQTIASVARAAEQRGYVALPVNSYLRARIVGSSGLDERTLLLLDTDSDAARAHTALLHASTRSPRPHLLLTMRAGTGSSHAAVAREARAAYAVDRVEVARFERSERMGAQVLDLLARANRVRELTERGRHAAAERLLRDIAAALERRGATRYASRVTVQRGRMFLDRAATGAACEAFEHAVRLAQSAGCDALAIEARLWQASARIMDAAFVEAESICRAILEASELPSHLRLWAHATLADALLWQARPDAPDFDISDASMLDSAVLAAAHEVRMRQLLARGQLFEAGQCVESLRRHAVETKDATAEVAAAVADVTLLATTGQLPRIKKALDAAIIVARRAKMPLRAAWARLVWIDVARRAGRPGDAVSHLECVKRFSRVAPALLQREIARRVASEQNLTTRQPVITPTIRHSALAIALLRIGHADEQDTVAVRRVLERVLDELQASRVDLLSDAAGPVTLVGNVGEGLTTTLGRRVLEAGFAIGPERQAGGWEMGIPVRLASRMLGTIVCRWPIDRTVPADATDLLELAAVIMAPRIDSMRLAAQEEVRAATAVPELLGVSEAMTNVRRAIVRAAAAPFNVLIEGESGVGKELVARAVHQLSARRERKFCDVNCAALPEDLLESELFGHARGAFSGAVVDRIGLFEEADGGTLLLDEAADLSARAQAKLLRVIQQQEVRRVGESFVRKIDVRIVAAVNRDMRAEAAAGRFRQDLLYRLDVVRIQVPPLRERPADIPVLAEHCWSLATARTGSHARLSSSTLNDLCRYHWPGNVRELQNVVASLAVAAPTRGWVRPASLPAVIGSAAIVASGRLADAREQFERRFVEVALARAGGNRAHAARALGISRQGLAKIIARLGIASC
jgi:DNA-binding NtrC family response regulator